MSAILDIQLASEHPDIPSETDIQLWLNTLLSHQQINQAEVTIRMVDEEEIQALNLQYRGKDKTTNVLSFPFEIPELFLPETSPEALPEALPDTLPDGLQIDDSMSDFLGDIVICAQVVEQESKEQNKHLNHHWAHMLIHGTLHLLGYDHIKEPDAEEMESIEITVLQKLAIDDPYQDH